MSPTAGRHRSGSSRAPSSSSRGEVRQAWEKHHIRKGEQGFSYVGALDKPGPRKKRSIEAHDNARFASSNEHAGLASPDGVEPPVLDLWREE